MSNREYRFVSHWSIPAPIADVEAALLNTQDWQTWWDGLEDIRMDQPGIGVGSRFHCKWRSMTGYHLDLVIEITSYQQGRDIEFDSSGDLLGKGDFQMKSDGPNTTAIVIHWNVATTKAWMNVLGPILKPLFVLNHDKLMQSGEQGLAKYVLKSHN